MPHPDPERVDLSILKYDPFRVGCVLTRFPCGETTRLLNSSRFADYFKMPSALQIHAGSEESAVNGYCLACDERSRVRSEQNRCPY